MNRSIFRGCLLLLMGMLMNAPAFGAEKTLKAIVDRAVESARKDSNNVGMVVGVISGGQRYVRGYGRLATDRDQAPDENTIFEIGSLTKTFTSLALAGMVQDRLVAYGDPVQKYVPPDCHIPTRAGKQITLENLATHTSGLPRIPPELAIYAIMRPDPYARYTPELMCRFLGQYELPRDIGSQWEYSNLGGGLLGYALARQAKCTYEQLIVERICRPLGMSDTTVTLSSNQRRRLAKGHAGTGEPASEWHFDALAGAGALHSSAADLLRYAAAQLQPPASPLGKSIRDTQRIRVKKTSLPDHAQALGWLVLHMPPDFKIYWHNGGTGGYECFLGFRKDVPAAVVILSNSDPLSETATMLGLGLMTEVEFASPSSSPAAAHPAGRAAATHSAAGE